MDNAQFTSAIKLLCKKQGITVSALLETCSLRKGLIYDVEKRNAKPSIEVVETIAKHLNCSIDYLLGHKNSGQFSTSDDAHFVALIKFYETLNELGRSEAEKRIEELAQIPKYIESKTQEEFNIG